MTTYRRFKETNDHEGETWSWWLQVEGNEDALDTLARILSEAAHPDEFSLEDDVLTATEVDLLVRFGESTYFASHNRIDGLLRLPEGPANDIMEDLYKGGIRDLFTEAAS